LPALAQLARARSVPGILPNMQSVGKGGSARACGFILQKVTGLGIICLQPPASQAGAQIAASRRLLRAPESEHTPFARLRF
jgi:hypothetical protein